MLHRLLNAVPALVLTALAGASAPALAQYQDGYHDDRRYDDRYEDRYYDSYDRDPPERVGRLAYVSGDASFSPGGGEAWYRAVVNRPVVRGDRLYTGSRGLLEVQLGGAALRLDEHTAVDVLTLDEEYVQVELAEGTLSLSIEYGWEGAAYEIATPMAAIVVTEPGSVRIDVDPRTGVTDVVVWDGRAEAYGTRVTFPLRDGDAVRFHDPELYDYEMFRLPRPDRFDRWVRERDQLLVRSASRRYLPQGVIGYADLDRYGAWDSVADYGNVWFPRSVQRDWAPYRHGHWIWQDPWGWTWVDDAPWGFAPFHYGRWVHVGSRWGWVPGPRQVRAVYAPALVAFVGGSNFSVGVSLGSRPVGWFPLGPREVYVPPYRASRDYFRRVNVSNTVINTTVVTNVYNTYYVRDTPVIRDLDYRYRTAATAVPADAFVRGTPVSQARIQLDARASARAEVRRFASAAPQATSLAGAVAQRAKAQPPARTGQRPVIARRAPAPEPVPFDVRAREIQRNEGRPLAREQVQRLQESKSAAPQARQVRVVGEPQQQVSRERTQPARSVERELPRGEVAPRGRAPAASAARDRADLEPRNARPERGAAQAPAARPAADSQPAARGSSPRGEARDKAAERTPSPRQREAAPAAEEQRASQARAQEEARGRAAREQQQRTVQQRADQARAQEDARDRAVREQNKRDQEQRAAAARTQEEARSRAVREQQQRATEQRATEQRAAQARAQEEARSRAVREQQQRATEQRAAQARAQEEARSRAVREQPQQRAVEPRSAPARAQQPPSRAVREPAPRSSAQPPADAAAPVRGRAKARTAPREESTEEEDDTPRPRARGRDRGGR